MWYLLFVLLCSCARQTSPDVYSDQSFGEVSATYPGTVVEVHKVTIQAGDNLSDNTIGGVGGGVAGALLGSTVGHGAGTVFAEIGGAIAGATGGALLEGELRKGEALQYIVQLDSGEYKTVVQAMKPFYQKGDKVWVIMSQQGRSRIIQR